MSTALIPFDDMERMAVSVAASKLFGISNKDQAVALMLLCQAEGLHPAIAARDYHIIQGRPALKADAMLARFQQAGGSVQWKDYTDEKVTGIFSHPSGGSLEVTWTLAQAKAVGIANKDNWKNYPRAMLRARCVSEGIRSVYPGCVVGVYTPEEVQDFTPSKTIDMGMVHRDETVLHSEGESLVVEDGAFKLYVPNLDEPHSSYHSVEDWIDAYGNMVGRIMSSSKISDSDKAKKVESLKVANEFVVDGFSTVDKLKVKAAIAEAGGNPLPKQSVSQDV